MTARLETISHLAAAIESLAADPHVRGLASMIRGLCLEDAAPAPPATSRSADRRQIELFGDPDRPDRPAAHDPVSRPDATSATYAASDHATDDPSSSSSVCISDQKKKKKDRVTVNADDPIPAWAARVYDQVLLAKPDLPPLALVWGDFADYIVEKRKTYATLSGLQRRFRQWLLWQRPIEATPASSGSAAKESTSAVHTESTDVLATQEGYEAEAASTELALAEASRLASGSFALSRVRPGSTMGSTGPPARAQAVA